MMKKKNHFKKEDKRKQEKRGNFDDIQKEQLRKYEKKEKKVMCDNLQAGGKEQLKKVG